MRDREGRGERGERKEGREGREGQRGRGERVTELSSLHIVPSCTDFICNIIYSLILHLHVRMYVHRQGHIYLYILHIH